MSETDIEKLQRDFELTGQLGIEAQEKHFHSLFPRLLKIGWARTMLESGGIIHRAYCHECHAGYGAPYYDYRCSSCGHMVCGGCYPEDPTVGTPNRPDNNYLGTYLSPILWNHVLDDPASLVMYRVVLRHFTNLRVTKGDPVPALCLVCGTYATTRVEWKIVTSTHAEALGFLLCCLCWYPYIDNSKGSKYRGHYCSHCGFNIVTWHPRNGTPRRRMHLPKPADYNRQVEGANN